MAELVRPKAVAPIYTAFYTRGTLYEKEAARLRVSLDRFGLEHDIRGIDDRGSWMANSQWTASHVCEMMEAYRDRPIVQLDADAFLWQRPALFDDIDCDIAFYRLPHGQLANGTVYLAPNASAKAVAERYRAYVRANPMHRDEQYWLDVALKQLAGRVRIVRLPASYCYIHDINHADLVGPPVIEHLQASRESNVTDLTDSRRRRIAFVESQFPEVFNAA